MRKYRFIVEMENGLTYSVYAFSDGEANVLVKAFCILMGMSHDVDIITGEKLGLATRSLANPAQFEKEFATATPIKLHAE